jgi:hypothetical protein
MAAARNPRLAFGLITIINEPLELLLESGMQIEHKHIYKLRSKYDL